MNLLQRIFKLKPASTAALPKPAVNGEAYYLLECWNQYANLPEDLLPYVDVIKTKADWEALGFVLELNKYGQVRKFKSQGKYFSFIRVEGNQPNEAEAIRTGKRLTHNPEHIAVLIQQGCRPVEFLYAPDLSLR